MLSLGPDIGSFRKYTSSCSYDCLPCDPALDGATFLGEADIVLFLDNLPDTQDGEFDFHILERHWELVKPDLTVQQGLQCICHSFDVFLYV